MGERGDDGDRDAQARAAERLERRRKAIEDALRGLVREYGVGRAGAHAFGDGEVKLDLGFVVQPGADWAVRFEPEWRFQLGAQLDEAAARYAALVPGRVYCFRCASGRCEHAAPPDSLSVFRGYTSTGVPEWCELVQALIDTGDQRVETLYDASGSVLAAVQLGRDLKRRQSPVFGRSSKTYSILGQVIAGYFRVPKSVPATGGRLALTVQIVETREAAGGPGIKLQPVAGEVERRRFGELLVRDEWDHVRRALDEASRAVAEMEELTRKAWQTDDPSRMRRVLGGLPRVLGRLARGLEQGARRRRRRTRHAEQQRERSRPVHKALEEARSARDEALYVDDKRGTWVACGRQGRAHVFNTRGRHVTSFQLPAGGAAFRVRTERWRRMDDDEVRRFREALA